MADPEPPVTPIPINFSEEIEEGMGGIVFPNTNGDKNVLLTGMNPKVGNKLVIHPSKTGEWLTHGLSQIKVGDKVLVLPLSDGDKCALRPGPKNPFTRCQLIPYIFNNLSVESEIYPGHDFYKKYVFNLKEPIQRVNGSWPRVNLRMDFDVKTATLGSPWSMWYPNGGVYLGVSEDGDDWFWCTGTGSPYLVVCGPPMFYSHDEGSARFCVTNWLGGCPTCCPPPFDEINHLEVHIHTTSSLFFTNSTTETRLLYLTLCEGFVEDNWCDSLSSF